MPHKYCNDADRSKFIAKLPIVKVVDATPITSPNADSILPVSIEK